MKSAIRLVVAILVTSFALAAPVAADDKAGKEKVVDQGLHAEIRTMLKLSGQGELGIQAMRQMIGSFKQAMPQVPQEFWDEFVKEADPDDLIDLVVPIYAKHFTRADIMELVTFYNSPVGKKLIEKQPLIMKESMAAGEVWGEEISKKLLKRLAEKGYRT